MTTNAALAELESTADVNEAKRDLVLRFVRDQESLQTSQVELKLVDDDTIDLIDSAFTANEIVVQENNEQTNSGVKNNEDLLTTGVSWITLDGEEKTKRLEQDDMAQMPRPPSGRPQSRKAHRRTNSELREKRKISYSSRIHDVERLSSNSPMSPVPVDAFGSAKHHYLTQPEFNSNSTLNSSWPQQVFSRKTSTGSSYGYRKHAIQTPEKHFIFEGEENIYPRDPRPTSSQSFQRMVNSGEAVTAAHIRKHSANERITCDINQMIDSPIHHSRSSSPVKSRRSTSKGRTLMNLGLEPVDPSEIPMLRAASAGKAAALSGPYTLVQLPPISRETPAATPPFS